MLFANSSKQMEYWYDSLRPRFMGIGLRLGYGKEELSDIINQFFLDILEKNVAAKTINNPQAYLSTAFRRKLIDHYRDAKKNNFVEREIIPEQHVEPSILDKLEHIQSNTELISRIKCAYKKLPARCEKVIYLKFYEGLSTEQIAERTGLNKRTVYNNLFEGIKILRAELSPNKTGLQFAALLSLLPLVTLTT